MIRAICSSIYIFQLFEPAMCLMALSGMIVTTIADTCAHVLHAARLRNSNRALVKKRKWLGKGTIKKRRRAI